MRRSAVVLSCLGLLIGMACGPKPTAGGDESRSAHLGFVSATCAEAGNLFLPSTTFDAEMVVSSQAGGPAPTGIGVAGSSAPAVGGVSWVWYQVVNERLSGLPSDFGPNDSNSWVTTYPRRILEVTETVDTFSSAADASTFLSEFTTDGPIPPEVIVSGTSYPAKSEPAKALGLGDESISRERRPPATGFPALVQYVVRLGTTVVTLELVGGNGITAAGSSDFASMAVAQVQQTCSS